jgi:hypothetical protein
MRSHPRRLHRRNRHYIRKPSRHSGVRKPQLPPVTGPDGFRSSTTAKADDSNLSLLHEDRSPDGTMEVKRKGSVRNALDLGPGSSRWSLPSFHLREVSTPDRDHGVEEMEDQLGTNRYAFTTSFLGHLIATYATAQPLHSCRRVY